jgi:hypothetical protein
LFADAVRLYFGEGEVEITITVALEGVAGPVSLEGVEFDAESALRPVDVDLIAELVPTGSRSRQGGGDETGDETPLEIRAAQVGGS